MDNYNICLGKLKNMFSGIRLLLPNKQEMTQYLCMNEKDPCVLRVKIIVYFSVF